MHLPADASMSSTCSSVLWIFRRNCVYPGLCKEDLAKRPKFSGGWMLFWQEYIKQWGSHHAMRLEILCLRQWLYLSIPIPIVFWYIMTESCDHGAVLTISLHIFLSVKGCRGEFLYPEEIARCWEELAKNWDSLSVNTDDGIPYGITQMFKNNFATCHELIWAVGITRVRFENLFVIITICWFPVVLSESGPKISRATSSRRPAAGKSWGFRLCVNLDPFGAHEQNSCTSIYTF